MAYLVPMSVQGLAFDVAEYDILASTVRRHLLLGWRRIGCIFQSRGTWILFDSKKQFRRILKVRETGL
jgi:hypothetical protein